MSNFRSKAFNPASKRVEDAEYCDDYYGRHRYGIRFDDGCVHPEAQCGIDAAATQLDSLLKERDALQARVKELAELHAQQAELASKSIRRLAELAEPGAIGAFASRDHWQSRALRAEQERDEAVTSTRYKIFDNLLGAYIGADNEQLRAAIGNFAFMSFPEYRDSLRKTAEECRLSAGPEKEKKE